MRNTKHLDVRLLKIGCGHYVTVPKDTIIERKDVPICQICAQRKNEKADIDHARATFVGNLPSYFKEKTLQKEQIIDTIKA